MFSVKLVRLIAYILVVLAVIGAFTAHSSVPFWDMWNGYLGFYVDVSDGNWLAWWQPHNEHRIVLSRVLFWIDIKFFNGLGWFLIVCNLLLLLMIYQLFKSTISHQITEVDARDLRQLLCALLLAMLFSWIQEENLTWGFQTQFFLAMALPLAAFLQVVNAVESDSRWPFVVSCLAGIASLGTMANGVIVLPLLFLLGLVLNVGIRERLLLGGLAIFGPLLYFHGYVAPENHGSITKALIEQPVEVVEYLLVYLGGPFYHLSGGASILTAKFAGFSLLVGCAIALFDTLLWQRSNARNFALLAFLLYLGATAFATAGGRVVFGVEQATSGRYMTVAIVAWCTLIVLYAPKLVKLCRRRPRVLEVLLVLTVVSLIPSQLGALSGEDNRDFDKKVAALSLELGVKDQKQIRTIFPSAEWALQIAKAPAERNLSVFGIAPIKDAAEMLGKSFETLPDKVCQGALDEVSAIVDSDKYMSVRGWLFAGEEYAVPSAVYIFNRQHILVGYALTGQHRPDVASAIHIEAKRSGFLGYLMKDSAGDALFLATGNLTCKLAVSSANTTFSVYRYTGSLDEISATSKNITGNNSMNGTDFSRSHMPGILIIGSYRESDSDVGEVSFNLSRNDAILYRTGPVARDQYLMINQVRYPLPVAEDWAVLKFSSEVLPDRFVVTLIDDGRNWGEWSAVGVRAGESEGQ